jgi:S-adenosylmethionine synthetase
MRHNLILIRSADRYGPAPRNSDSAVNILLDVVQDQSGKQYKMDHYQTRFPTNVIDIGHFLVRLTGLDHIFSPLVSPSINVDWHSHLIDQHAGLHFNFNFNLSSSILEFTDRMPLTAVPAPLPQVMHFSAQEPFTKYEMCLIFSKLLGLPHAHIIPDAEPPKVAQSRPTVLTHALKHSSMWL